MRAQRTEYTDYEWFRGNLSWLLRPHGQTWIHDFIQGCRYDGGRVEPVVINAHRRLGKSFLNSLLAVEAANAKPYQIIKLICGEKEQVRDIYEPLIAQILETCPPELFPKVRALKYIFRNPAWPARATSVLQLCGANYKRGDMARGTACDKAFLDEVRDFKDLEYFVQAVLSHQFQGREDPLLVMTSTPPWTMDHPFTRPETGYIPQGITNKRYIVVPGSKNPDFTQRDKDIVLGMVPGGEEDPAYLREVECELIGDVGRLIVPEYQRVREEVVLESYERPAFMVPYVVLDTGWDPDYTAILFGYLDWIPQLLIFEAEVVQKRMTTKEIATAIKDMEHTLEYDKLYHRPRRIADLDERGLADLSRVHKLYIMPVEKYDSKGAVSNFRHRIQQKQIRVIMPGCKQLDYQLHHGIWNERGTDFERSVTLGHCDALKAAVYLNRMLNWNYNPIPDDHRTQIGVKAFSAFRGHTDTQNALLRALGRV